MIIRGPRPKDHFTRISNDVLRDSALSYRARGVLASILSRPDGWVVNFKALAREGREGESAIRTALAELREAGYMRQETSQTQGGRWSTITVVYDSRQHVQAPPSVGNHAAPSVGKPSVGKPSVGNHPPIRSTGRNEQQEETPLASLAPPTANADEPAPKPKTTRGTRLPEDWAPSQTLVAWAKASTPNVGRLESDSFVDYWHARPGSGGLKTNWDATWRNWMRRAQRDYDERHPPSGERTPSGTPRQQARAEMLATWENFLNPHASQGQATEATVIVGELLAREDTP
jgi:hypothetical protein